MSEANPSRLRREMEAKTTRELLNIWHTKYREEWTRAEFRMVGRVLAERDAIDAHSLPLSEMADDTAVDDAAAMDSSPELIQQVQAALLQIRTESSPRWKRGFLFVASLLAFLFVLWLLTKSHPDRTLRYLVILPSVLFVHEMGHYLVMRRFGYRNLRMFFIPLFGAAVAGRGTTPVHQAAIVSLAGPLPGILMGCICSWLALRLQNDLLGQLGRTFVLLNALNLLPVYPLDGGRLVFGLLPPRTFAYQWLLQIGFVVLCVLIDGCFSLTSTIDFTGMAIGVLFLGMKLLYDENKWAKFIMELPPGLAKPPIADEIPTEITAQLVKQLHSDGSTRKPAAIAEMIWAAWLRATAQRPTGYATLALVAIYILAWGTTFSAMAAFGWSKL